MSNRLFVVGFWVIFTAGMAFMGRNVAVSYTLPKMLPDEDPAMVEYADFQSEFTQSANLIVLGAKDESFFTPSVLNQWHDLAKRIESTPEVLSVLSIHNALDLYMDEAEGQAMQPFPLMVGPVKSPRQGFALRDQYEDLPFYRGMLRNDDGRTHLMMVSISDHANYSTAAFALLDQLAAEIKRFERNTGIDVNMSGLPYLRLSNAQSIKSEISLFIVLTCIVTILIMLLMLKSLRSAIIALSVVGVGLAGTFGIMGIFGHHLSIFSGMIPPLLIVIAVPNCIFFINKYHSVYAVDKEVLPALHHTVNKIGSVALLTNVTTAMGFATFIFTSSTPLVNFAIGSSLSILVVFAASITLLPVLYSWLPKPSDRHYEHLNQGWVRSWINWLIKVVMHHRKWTYLSAFLIVVLTAAGMLRLKTTGNLTADFSEADPMVQQVRFFERELGGVVPLDVIIDTKVPGGVWSTEVLESVDAFQQAIMKLDHLSRPFSMVDVLKFGRQGYMGGSPDDYTLPSAEERRAIVDVLPVLDTAIVSTMASSLINADESKLHIIIQIEDLMHEDMVLLLEDVDALAEASFDTDEIGVTLSGVSVLFMRSTDFLINNLLLSLGLAILIISALMAALFKAPRMVVVSIIPNLLPLIMTAGLMGWFQIPIKPSTVLTFSIAFGISVDDTLHYLARYRQELVLNGGSIRDAAIKAIQETGISMFYTSVVLFAGFLIFLASSFGGTQALGLLVSITLVFAMFTNLILLPSMLMSMDKRVSAEEFKDILIDLAEDDV
jgi:predicted RND superfamily exporter protein